ncbi:hypothetical protein AB0J63_50130 [Streptosporangium canum]|uniref:hypothetical protein n=1 Tax=Streptosporangium canum TaxID=324952 RepID=UPI003446614E
MIKMLLRAGAVALASAAALSLVAASPAAAGSAWNGCNSGNVCLYGGNPVPSYLRYQTPGLVPNGKTFWVIVNNGNYSPGADHVRFEYRPVGSSGSWHSKCLHYRPDGGSMLDMRDGPVPAEIRNMYWGGEC